MVVDKIKKVEDLGVFKLSHSLGLNVYKIDREFSGRREIRPHFSDEAVSLFYPHEYY